MIVLETERLTLRPPMAADAPAIALYLGDFAVAGNLARVPHPYRLADAQRWLAMRRTDPGVDETDFGIELHGAGYIGQVGFHGGGAAAELGYWLGPPFWHRGLMTEAARAVIAWYFGATAADRIISGVFQFNKASLAVQKKLGFVETGSSQRHCLARHEDLRHIDTQLSRADWAGAAA